MQHFDGEFRDLDKLSIKNIQEYAKMVGAEYQLIRGKPFRKHLTSPCQKVYMLNEKFDDYDNVLMLDIDMFAPIGMKENVFDAKGAGLYEDIQRTLHQRIANRYPLNASINFPYWGGAIYKLDRSARIKLRGALDGDDGWMLPYNKAYEWEDEGIMHGLAVKTGYNPKEPYMDRKWCQCSYLPNPERAGFLHIRTKVTPTGPKREKIENYNDLVLRNIL